MYADSDVLSGGRRGWREAGGVRTESDMRITATTSTAINAMAATPAAQTAPECSSTGAG